MINNLDTPKSSNIKRISYDDTTATLTVAFKSGGIYEYYSVPMGLYDKFIHANSFGRFHYMFIRNHFSYKKISN